MQTSNLTRVDYQNYFGSGFTYQQYQSNFEKELLEGSESTYTQYLSINWQRIKRIEKTFKLSIELFQVISNLSKPRKWLVISEHWCGDAAQILPVLHSIAEASNGKISMRIVYRDQNTELMDAHLTGASRSIPKLVQLNEDFEPFSEWGPRPSEAQDLVINMKSDPATAPSYSEHLHKWYAKNKQADTVQELIKLLNTKT